MQFLRAKVHLIILSGGMLLAAFFRFWAAPLSAGPDIAQFWAFARVFQQYGLDFYRYAAATLDIFPFKSWAFVYPPVWLLTLRAALLGAPLSQASATMVDIAWRVAMKTPVILADLAIGGLLYWAVPGSRLKKLVFAGLWLFHPTAWYSSAVFGQFDAIAAAFMLAAIVLLERGIDIPGFLCAGLAVMTKQHTLLGLALVLLISFRTMERRRFMTGLGVMLALMAAISLPFIFNGNLLNYARSLFLPGQAPGYQYPLVYAFSGSGALVTYLHDTFGWDNAAILRFNTPLLAIAIAGLAVFAYRRMNDLVAAALVGILAFIAIFYRINYQYLVIYIPLALLLAARTQWKAEKALAFALALLPAVWLWLFDVSFWFNYLSPVHPWVIPLLDRFGLVRRGIPDVVFVFFALTLTALCVIYISGALAVWYRNKTSAGRASPSKEPSHV